MTQITMFNENSKNGSETKWDKLARIAEVLGANYERFTTRTGEDGLRTISLRDCLDKHAIYVKMEEK